MFGCHGNFGGDVGIQEISTGLLNFAAQLVVSAN